MKEPLAIATTVVTLALLFAGTNAVTAGEKSPKALTMTLSSHVSTPRNDVNVRARVEPDERSRELVIEWIADDLSGGSHTITLEGARAAPSHRFTLRHLSPGRYVVTATLRRNDGTVSRTESNLQVVGVGDLATFGLDAPQGSREGVLRPAAQP